MTYEPSWKSVPQTWSRLKEPARQHRKDPTQAESLLWGDLRDAQLGPRFRRQHTVGPYIVDFYCAAARLVIEVDGPIHEQMKEQDRARSEFLEAKGLNVIRFTNSEVFESRQHVLASIKALLVALTT